MFITLLTLLLPLVMKILAALANSKKISEEQRQAYLGAIEAYQKSPMTSANIRGDYRAQLKELEELSKEPSKPEELK